MLRASGHRPHGGRGTNLHAVSDSSLIRSWRGGVEALRGAVAAGASTAKGAGTSAPTQWTEESCRIVVAPGSIPAATFSTARTLRAGTWR